MNILVTAATKLELLPIKSPLRQAKIPGLSVDFFVTGMGFENTLHSLTKYVETKDHPDLIINIGISGYHGNDVKKGEPHQILRVKNIHTDKERLLTPHFKIDNTMTCYCSEVPVTKNCLPNTPYYLLDMESWPTCWVAEKYNISKAIFKIPYDKIGEETKNFDKKECEKFLEKVDCTKIISGLEYLSKVQEIEK